MATLDPSKMTFKDYAIGAAIIFVCIVVVFMAAGAFVPATPQWVLSAIASVLGIALWSVYLKKRNG